MMHCTADKELFIQAEENTLKPKKIKGFDYGETKNN